MQKTPENLQVIDSHTEGEPTRVVIAGVPELSGGAVRAQCEELQRHHDWLRTALLHEPRGADVMVGAVLCRAAESGCAAGVIFFNNVGYLGMCGHGTMGVLATLAYLGRIGPGRYTLETPVGVVSGELHADGRISIRNVPSYRARKGVSVSTSRFGRVTGDVAWGGNWFFLVSDHAQRVSRDHIPALTEFCLDVRRGLALDGITGDDGAEIDHVEVFGPSHVADAVNFVLCPGGAYDRSPCGTGLSAKVACLAADGQLAEGQIWRQESVTGGLFEAQYHDRDDCFIPTITGRAFVNAELTVIFDPHDPLRFGMGGKAAGG